MPEVATFRTKTLNFTRVIHLNWLEKIELEWARASWSSILLVITIVRVYRCTQKSLKETETEETIGFFGKFLSLVAF